MDTETAANQVVEAEATPIVEAASPTEGANSPAEGESGDLDILTKEALGEPAANPEFIEIEIDGKKLKVAAADGSPLDPDLKFGALRDADYRKKTMTLSEEKKAIEQERASLQARANLQGEAAMRAQQLMGLDAQIRQFSQIQVDDLRAQGWTEQQIQQAQGELQDLTVQRDALKRQVESAVEQASAAEKRAFAEAREKAVQAAQLADKALTPERITALESFAVAEGVDQEDIALTTDPTVYKLLHYADIGKKFIERQRNAAQIRAAAGQPATTLGGASTGGKAPEDMGPDEMARLLGYSP